MPPLFPLPPSEPPSEVTPELEFLTFIFKVLQMLLSAFAHTLTFVVPTLSPVTRQFFSLKMLEFSTVHVATCSAVVGNI